MNITYEKAFMLSKKKGAYLLDKEPGSSVTFANNPGVINILLLVNVNTIALQIVTNQYSNSNMFVDWNRKADDFASLEVSKEEFFSLLKNHPAHFEWFLFNF